MSERRGAKKKKLKRRSFCFRKNEKQAVQIPSESNENKMGNNGENNERRSQRGKTSAPFPFFFSTNYVYYRVINLLS